jgi:hypothetical protein
MERRLAIRGCRWNLLSLSDKPAGLGKGKHSKIWLIMIAVSIPSQSKFTQGAG